MSILNALKKLEGGYNASTRLTTDMIKLDESRRQFDITTKLKERQLDTSEELQDLNTELTKLKIDESKFNRFQSGLNLIESELKEQEIDFANRLFVELQSFEPISNVIKTIDDGDTVNTERAVNKLVKDNVGFSREDAIAALNFIQMQKLSTEDPKFLRSYIDRASELENKINLQTQDAGPSKKFTAGIGNAFRKKNLFSNDPQKYTQLSKIQRSLDAIGKERTESFQNKDYKIDRNLNVASIEDMVALIDIP